MTELLGFLFIISLSIITIDQTIASRCYLCSQNLLAECVGSNQPDSSIYTSVLRYYTEPCNGQCVLFRNENRSIVRGCSWTYGHMTRKTIGWHEISPGINAYFCDTDLCNNGTYEQPELKLINHQLILSPQELFLLAGNNPLGQHFPRQLHQCYSCTARFQGCGEYLDPRYAGYYIRPCPSSCIIFRNPNDLNFTRDCSAYWPQVQVKNGLQKLLGSDAFFCQESLCNGISFDFIMSIFHNQLPTVITFPSILPISNNIPSTTIQPTTNIYNDNAIWDDPDLDLLPIESTTPSILNDFTDDIFPSSTIVGGLANVETNSSLNWWDLNDTLLSSFPVTSTLISSTILIDDDDWIINNTSSIPPITRFEQLSVDDEEFNHTLDDFFTSNIESNSAITIDLNDYILSPTSTTTPIIDNKTKDQVFDFTKPLAMPPFTWMLNQAAKNKSQSLNNSTTTTTTTTTTTEKQIEQLTTTTPLIIYEYCKNKKCHHGGRLTSDCLCICLPAFSGDNCETVLCDEEPGPICSIVLEHECESSHIRYLCPKFCQMDICSSKKM